MSFIENITRMMMDRSAPGECWRDMNIEYLRVMLPELAATQAVIQRQEETVYEHTLKVLNKLGAKTPVTLWAAIFHDAGKAKYPRMEGLCAAGYPCHASISAELADCRLRLWRVDSGFAQDVIRLVRTHMTDIAGFKHPQAYRGFVASVGLRNIDNWFTLRRADSLAYGVNAAALAAIERFREDLNGHLGAIRKVAVSELALSREQIASQLGLHDDEETGRIMERLVDAVNSGTCGNTVSQLTYTAHQFVGTGDRKGIVLG